MQIIEKEELRYAKTTFPLLATDGGVGDQNGWEWLQMDLDGLKGIKKSLGFRFGNTGVLAVLATMDLKYGYITIWTAANRPTACRHPSLDFPTG